MIKVTTNRNFPGTKEKIHLLAEKGPIHASMVVNVSGNAGGEYLFTFWNPRHVHDASFENLNDETKACRALKYV